MAGVTSRVYCLSGAALGAYSHRQNPGSMGGRPVRFGDSRGQGEATAEVSGVPRGSV